MKDPAFLFYSSDFMMGTLTMSNEHVGMYIRLLCLQHQKGSLTEQDMKYICTTYVEDVYNKFVKRDGLYYNERLEVEVNKRKKYSESRRENINKRYSEKATHEPSYVPTHVVHMENENEIENINSNEVKNVKKSFIPNLELLDPFWKSQFERWIQYRKEIKHPFRSQSQIDACIKSLIKLSGGQSEIAEAIIDQSIGNGWQGLFQLKTNGQSINQQSNGKPRPATDADIAAAVYKHFGNGQ